MICPFCDDELTKKPKVDTVDHMETGGRWTVDEWRCAACGAEIVHDVTFKLGDAREKWQLVRASAHCSRPTRLHCPSCDGWLVSAKPRDVEPEPATWIGAGEAHNERRIDHVCIGCTTRLVLVEHVESTWCDATSHSPAVFPKLFSRGQ